jgi:hypothetical protein
MGGPNGRGAVLRQLVWYFVEHSDAFDAEGFDTYVRAALLPQVGSEEGKALMAEVQQIMEDRERARSAPPRKSFLSPEGVGAWLKKRQQTEEG